MVETEAREMAYQYLSYARYCAVSVVTGGPIEEMNGIPVPAGLLFEKTGCGANDRSASSLGRALEGENKRAGSAPAERRLLSGRKSEGGL